MTRTTDEIVDALSTIADYLSIGNKEIGFSIPNGRITFEFDNPTDLDMEEILCNDKFGILSPTRSKTQKISGPANKSD